MVLHIRRHNNSLPPNGVNPATDSSHRLTVSPDGVNLAMVSRRHSNSLLLNGDSPATGSSHHRRANPPGGNPDTVSRRQMASLMGSRRPTVSQDGDRRRSRLPIRTAKRRRRDSHITWPRI